MGGQNFGFRKRRNLLIIHISLTMNSILLFLLVVFLIALFICNSDATDAAIQENAHPRRLPLKRQIKFRKAEIVGESYKRKFKPNVRVQFHRDLSVSKECSSDQIHITLGDDDSSMIVSFASYSQVWFL